MTVELTETERHWLITHLRLDVSQSRKALDFLEGQIDSSPVLKKTYETFITLEDNIIAKLKGVGA